MVTRSCFLQICNAVTVAALLNATLVIPRFLYSNVWKDPRSAIMPDTNVMKYLLLDYT